VVCQTKEEVAKLNVSLVDVYQKLADRFSDRNTANIKNSGMNRKRRKRQRVKPKSTRFDAE
jgi:hypothetical protein